MSKLGRRIRRAAVRGAAKAQFKRHRGPCFVRRCKENGGRKYHCVLCEKNGKEHAVQYCDRHEPNAEAAIKRHVLLKHPGVAPAWIVHKLKGGA